LAGIFSAGRRGKRRAWGEKEKKRRGTRLSASLFRKSAPALNFRERREEKETPKRKKRREQIPVVCFFRIARSECQCPPQKRRRKEILKEKKKEVIALACPLNLFIFQDQNTCKGERGRKYAKKGESFSRFHGRACGGKGRGEKKD